MKIKQIGFYTVNYFSLIVLLANVFYPLYVIIYNVIVFRQDIFLIRIAGMHAFNLLTFGLVGMVILIPYYITKGAKGFAPHQTLVIMLFYAFAHESIWNIFYLSYRIITNHFAMYILNNLGISFLLALNFFLVCKVMNILPWFDSFIFAYFGFLTVWALFGFPVSNSDFTLTNPALLTDLKINTMECWDVILFLGSIRPKRLKFPA